MKLIFILAIFMASTAGLADSSQAQGFDVIITTAVYCEPCKVLEADLRSKNQYDKVNLPHEKNVLVPIRHLDVQKDKNALLALGITSEESPVIYIFWHRQLILESEFYALTTEYVSEQIDKALKRIDFQNAGSRPTQDFKSRIQSQLSDSTYEIVLAGTGKGPEQSPIFIGYTLKTIKQILTENFNLSPSSFVVLGGSGYLSANPDFVRLDLIRDNSGKIISGFQHPVKVAGFSADESFTPQNFSDAIKTGNDLGKKLKLIVLSGHGSNDGVETWGSQTRLSPQDLGKIINGSSAPSIVVDGNCYGGALAPFIQCGFFGARPDTEASGCWQNEDAKVKDYPSGFFKALARAKQFENSNLNDVHFQAVLDGEPSDTPFTVLDGVADDLFSKYPELLPDKITFEDIKSINLTRGERLFLQRYLAGKNLSDSISLKKVDVKFNVKAGDQLLTVSSSIDLNQKEFANPATVENFDKTQFIYALFPGIAKDAQAHQLTLTLYLDKPAQSDFEICAYFKSKDPEDNANGESCQTIEIPKSPESNGIVQQVLRRGILRGLNPALWSSKDSALFSRFEEAQACEQIKVKDLFR